MKSVPADFVPQRRTADQQTKVDFQLRRDPDLRDR
jgi:hypothetical protein